MEPSKPHSVSKNNYVAAEIWGCLLQQRSIPILTNIHGNLNFPYKKEQEQT